MTHPDTAFRAAYLGLAASGELAERAARAQERLHDCVLCGRRCRVDRHVSNRGAACRTGLRAMVHSADPHHGEEWPLSGRNGSGTIFFGSCNLRCVYCQNWAVSRPRQCAEVTPDELAATMLRLQDAGCHNINLVSASHVVAQILIALPLAVEGGLRLPLVFNSGGYDSPEGLALLDGIVDIYMPDMKYGDSAAGRRYSGVKNYASVNRVAVREMHRQVGDLVLDSNGLALRGLLVRHLVLPAGLAASGKVFRFLAEEISTDTYVNVMGQYRPCYRADRYPPLDRPTSAAEFSRAIKLAHRYGLRRLDPGPLAQPGQLAG